MPGTGSIKRTTTFFDRNMDESSWNTLLASLPEAHILQSWQWAQVKARFGWSPRPTVWHDRQGNVAAAAMVLERSLQWAGWIPGARVMYVPKGPILRDWAQADLRAQVLDDLRALARRRGAIFVKIDPDVRLGEGIPGTAEACEHPLGEQVIRELTQRGWRFSQEQVQFRNTVLVDLSASEDELLGRMKQKTRYNIRLASRRGVSVRTGRLDDLEALYHMYAETSLRDGFVIRDQAYYLDVWRTFMRAGMAEALIAEVESEPVAALVLFRFAGKAWYLHGMSREAYREKMPNYLLQWKALQRAKDAGCRVYDLWGAPDEFQESDPLWGVYRFKEGLGGKVARHIGAWDLPARPLTYRVYTQFLPRALEWMRRRGYLRTREALSALH